jgi:hypothetical protein
VVPPIDEATISAIVRSGIMLLPTITLSKAEISNSSAHRANGFSHFFI